MIFQKISKPLLFLFLVLMIGWTHTVKGQSKNPLDPLSLDSIVIQNQRLQIPFAKQNRNIEVIGREAIQQMPVQTLDQLLGYVGGIDVRRRGEMGAQADISINGGTFDQTLVLINGMKIIDPQTGHNIMMLPVSLEGIERIEILKGPAAAAYGVNAINGAINIVTRQPNKTGIMAHATGGSSFKKDTVSNHLYTGMDVGVAASLASKKSRHFLSLNTIQSNGHTYNTGVDNKKLFYSNHIQLGQNNLEMMGGYTSHNFGSNAFYAAPVDTDSKEQVKTAIAAIKGKFRINDFWVMRPSFSYRYSDDYFVLNKFNPSLYENKHYSNIYDLELNNTLTTNLGTFGFGLEYRNNNITSNSLGNHDRNDFGFYGNYSLDIWKDVLINVGLYANYNSDYDWDWMPTLDLGYAVNSNLRLFTNIGTGMRQPTYTDLYYSGPANIGNPDLIPEKSWQTEAGLKYEVGNFRSSLTYFYRDTDHFIDWVKDNLEDPWTTLNYQNVRLHGLSLEGYYTVIPQTATSDFSMAIQASYTYLDPKLAKNDQSQFSNYALENLQHQLAGNIHFGFFNKVKLTLSPRYEKRMNYKDYMLLNARLSTEIKNFEIFLDGSNLTNIEFIEAGATPLAGSWLSLGVKWQAWK